MRDERTLCASGYLTPGLMDTVRGPMPLRRPNNDECLVLLGAGASAEAGVPTTFEMTEALVGAFETPHRRWKRTSQALHFAPGIDLLLVATAESNT